jgi:hypothetical protein
MTDKTQEQRDADAEAYVQMVKNSMPDVLRPEHIINICGALITSYGTSEEAMEWTKALVVAMTGYYAEVNEGDCDCPRCSERRRAMAH